MNLSRNKTKILITSFIGALLVYNFRFFFLRGTDNYLYGLFGTKHSYLNWISESSLFGFFELYSISFLYLIAIEPLNSIIGYFLNKIFESPYSALDALSFITLFLILLLITRAKTSLCVKCFCMLGTAIGFYEYIMFFDIYRFQIAMIFLIIGFMFPPNSNKQIILLLMSTLCHLSIILMLPIIAILNKLVRSDSDYFSFKSLHVVILLCFVTYLVMYFLIGETLIYGTGPTYGSTYIKRLDSITYSMSEYLLFIILFSFSMYLLFSKILRLKLPYIFYLISFVTYIFIIIYSLGTSRIIMLIYISILIHLLSHTYYSRVNSFAFLFFIPLFIHNMSRSFLLLDWGLS